MRYNLFKMAIVVVFSLIGTGVSVAEEDIFADYKNDMRKPAESRATNVYKAWGDNMAAHIEKGVKSGIVIDGAGSYGGGKVRADGVGNVTVDKGANVGPIINKTEIKNSPVIIRNRDRF
ncbi:hypothetical protein [Desulfovibrio sp. ZJ369]|uniref:hypothetical protein n=1 Tax=Desulfovibrio sp. ZJ369 TaxID=2709793 RepID=UPI00197D51A5|nr:hypothetical protein [Desulfovibrio sp. ZJ369]